MSEWVNGTLADTIDSLDAGVSVNAVDRPHGAGEIGVLKTSAISGGAFHFEQNKTILQQERRLAAEPVKADSILVSRMNTPALVGESCYVREAHPTLFLPDRLWQLKPKDRAQLNMRWLSFVLQSADYRRYVEVHATGTSGSMKNLPKSKLLTLPVQYPEPAEQVVIAQTLDTLDTAIRETEVLIDKLKAVKQGLLHDLLTRGINANGELRPPQSEAPQLYKESPLGWIPKEWECMEFSALGDYLNGNTFDAAAWKDTGLPIIRIQNLNGSSEFNYYSGAVQEKWHVCPGDLLFAWSGQRGVSFGARLWDGPKGVLNQHIFKVLPKESLASKAFLYRLLRFRQVTIEDAAHGFKDSFLHVTRGELGSVKVGVPSLDEQESIEQRISAFETKFLAEKAEFGKLKSMRSGLMDDLLTGRVCVTPLLQGASC